MSFLDRIQRGIRPGAPSVYVGRAERIARDVDARYAAPIAAWATEHGADRNDLTRAQRARLSAWLFTRNIEDATAVIRMAFIVWLVRRGWLGRGDSGP